MAKRSYKLLTAVVGTAFLLSANAASSQDRVAGITTPLEAYGFNIGDDYQLANYTQLSDYWHKLDAQSDRMQLVSIGKTVEGRDQLMAIISSPENMAKLDHYRDIARRMAQADGLTDQQARTLSVEGKVVVWIDGGLHATETVGAQHLSKLVYEMVSAQDPETLRILDNVILLVAHANPDGMELVSDWYMRHEDTSKREYATLPRLYHHYVGHDNNRDFVASNMPESANINRVLYRQWFPAIVYNHHQSGPAGTVVFMPTHRDPYNYNLEPLVLMGLENVGAAMNSRLVAEGKPGGGQRSVAPYTNWASTTLRANALFHNAIGVITEINGHPTPKQLPLVPDAQLPHNDLPMPIAPQMFHFRQAIEYSMSMDRAVLDYAARNSDHLLYARYTMAKSAIEKGKADHWTITPKRIAALNAAAKAHPYTPENAGWGMSYSPKAVDPALYDKVLHDPAMRDARAYVIPADQVDFPRAVGFVNALIRSGIEVERAGAPFTVAGKQYPAGSFLVKAGQPNRAMVRDDFEPQNHPDDIPYPGAAPIPPHNVTGYTLAYQMGVAFDRVFEVPTGAFQQLADEITPPPGKVIGEGKAGFLIRHEINNAFILTNRLLKAGHKVYWVKTATSADGISFAPGAIWVPSATGVRDIIDRGIRELGFDAYAVAAAPSAETIALRPTRVGLVDLYGGVMSSGWTRWIFENYEVPFEVIYPQDLDAGDLAKRFDTIVFANDVIRPATASTAASRTRQPDAADIPAEYRNRLGEITEEKTIPQIDAFLRQGGNVVAIGSSTRLAYQLHLPVRDALTETGADGQTKPLPRSAFYVPGSILASQVNNSTPLGYGMSNTADVYYYNSPAFKLADPQAGTRVSWFEGDNLLRSGWAWGVEHLDGASTVLQVPVGKGQAFLMGAEVTQLGQSQGTYKFLFNALLYGAAIQDSVSSR